MPELVEKVSKFSPKGSINASFNILVTHYETTLFIAGNEHNTLICASIELGES